jgi:hypothetical protein
MNGKNLIAALASLCSLFVALPSQAAALGAFSSVPLDHPAHAAGDYLARQGLPFGRMGCYGSRSLTRYEFVVQLQRVHAGYRQATKRIAEGGKAQPWEISPAFRRTLGDPIVLKRTLTWFTALIHEFAPECRLLQVDSDGLLRDVERWQQSAEELSARAQRLTFEEASVPSLEPEGPFADLAPVPEIDPSYATTRYLQDRIGADGLLPHRVGPGELHSVRAGLAWLRALTMEYVPELKQLSAALRRGR